MMAYWLMKSEPDVYGLQHLIAAVHDRWDGVRNYQARNLIRSMQRGDQAFFYHSNTRPPGIAGIMRIASTAYPDPLALDRNSPYFDARSSAESPRWSAIDVQFERQLKRYLPLDELRLYTETNLEGLALLRKGNRLSVMPVTEAQWQFILTLEHKESSPDEHC